MITPESMPAGRAGTVPVPLASLSVDGTPPAQGDNVTFTAAGRVVAVEAETAHVQVETINDQPIPADEASEDRAMMEAAEKADSEAY